MSLRDLAIVGRRVVTLSGMGPATLLLRGGRIAEIGAAEATFDAEVLDAGDSVVMPGLVDTHVHINEPGRTDWEGFETATRAAAAGGVTTLVDMPLNSVPPTTTVAGLRAKLEAAAGRCHVNVGFWGGLLPDNAAELEPLAAAGIPGFKCFLAPSGVPEFPAVGERDLRASLPELAELGSLLLVHAELSSRLASLAGEPRRYESYLGSRPEVAEEDAVELMVRLCREYRVPVHILHLSAAAALAPIAGARREGLPLTAETCPHYLFFSAEEIRDGATELKCAPPIRDRENREALWEAIRSGLLEVIVSDHSPSPPELKHRDSGDFGRAWGGIASLELGLPVVWTAASERGFSILDLARWMSGSPARLARMPQKGAIAPGLDADLVIWNPEETQRVDPRRLQQRHKLSAYAGRTLKGVVEMTFLAGKKVYDRGNFPGPPAGRLLLAGPARVSGAAIAEGRK